MKLNLLPLAFLMAPVLAWAQPTSGSRASTPIPTPLPPTAKPTVDLRHAPKISCLHPKFDFQTVDVGPDIFHEFTIRNRGKAPLSITHLGVSCGCYAAVVEKQGTKDEPDTLPVTLAPGEKGTIKATYHTSGHSGNITKVITVTSNDPVTPDFQLQISMNMVPEIEAQPDRIYLYNVKFKQAHDNTIKILGKAGMPLSILSVEAVNKVVTITGLTPVTETTTAPAPTPGQPAAEDQKRYGATMVVTLPATQPMGTIADEIVIKTDDPKKPEVHIQVMGEVVGRLQYNPKSISFSPHQDMPVTVQLNPDPPKGFEIRSVKSINHITRPSIRKITDHNGIDQYSLVVSVVRDLPKDSDGKDQIILETNDVDQKAVTIDVQASK